MFNVVTAVSCVSSLLQQRALLRREYSVFSHDDIARLVLLFYCSIYTTLHLRNTIVYSRQSDRRSTFFGRSYRTIPRPHSVHSEFGAL